MFEKLISKALDVADRALDLANDYMKEKIEAQKKKRVVNPERFLNEPKESGKNDFIEAKRQQSLKDSQGVSDFSGSGYNGPGTVDREKTNSNMAQRNFQG